MVDEVGGQHLVHCVQVPVDPCLHETAGQCHVLLCRHRSPPSCQPAFLYRVDTIHDATWRALAHRLEPYLPKLVDEGPRGSILLIPSTLSTLTLEGVAEALRSHPRGSEKVLELYSSSILRL